MPTLGTPFAPDLISAGSAAAMEALEQQAPAVNAPLPVIEEAVVSAGNTIDGLQSVADAIVVDPVAAQQAVQATADAVVAQPASPDGTPVLIFLVSALIVYQWSETIKAVPRVSGESPSSKLPSFESLAADARAKSTATGGERDAWEIFTAGIVNLRKASFDGWFFGPASPLYSNAASAGIEGTALPDQEPQQAASTSAVMRAAEPTAPLTTTSDTKPRLGAKELAKMAARGSAPAGPANVSPQSSNVRGGKRRKGKKKPRTVTEGLTGVVTPTGIFPDVMSPDAQDDGAAIALENAVKEAIEK